MRITQVGNKKAINILPHWEVGSFQLHFVATTSLLSNKKEKLRSEHRQYLFIAMFYSQLLKI